MRSRKRRGREGEDNAAINYKSCQCKDNAAAKTTKNNIENNKRNKKTTTNTTTTKAATTKQQKKKHKLNAGKNCLKIQHNLE